MLCRSWIPILSWLLTSWTLWASEGQSITCQGKHSHHLQGICVDEQSIYWSFTTQLVKTDRAGKLQLQIPVANHHGDLCFEQGKLYVAVNLGRFNDADGNADSWIYVYQADTLTEIARHPIPQVRYGAGGIGVRGGKFYVVGGLPSGMQKNNVFEFDGQFQLVRHHQIDSGYTLMGIQTATFADSRWWFGCYGNPKILLVADENFHLLGRFEFDCSLGISVTPDGQMLAASGRCKRPEGCTGQAQIVVPDKETGLRYLTK